MTASAGMRVRPVWILAGIVALGGILLRRAGCAERLVRRGDHGRVHPAEPRRLAGAAVAPGALRRAAAALAALALAGCANGEEPIEPPAGAARKVPETRVPFGAAVATDPARADAAYLRVFTETFDTLAAENATAMAVVQPERGDFDFAQLDALVALAELTDKRVRAALIWDLVLPTWLTDEPLPREEVREILGDHVRTLVERYRGRVDEWIVVNEPLDDDGSLTRSVWLEALGERYIADAFRIARRADPAATLILNEIAAERGEKFEGLLRLSRNLVRDDVPVDAVGLQNHTNTQNFPSREILADDLARIASLGLDAQITEMDVELDTDRPEASELRRQADAYRAAARACVQARRCTGFTVWGVTDPHSWKGAASKALLFDAEGEPKPAARAVLGVLARP